MSTITPIDGNEAVLKPKRIRKSISPKLTYSAEGEMIYSLLGGVIGDIAGSSREGYKRNTTSARKLLTVNSSFTDDTALMMGVAEWLNDKGNTSLSQCLMKWYNRYPHAGYGSRFRAFVQSGEAQSSCGNGGAMRVGACAVVAKSLEEAIALAQEQCVVSHLEEQSVVGAQAIASAAYIAKEGRLQGKSIAEIKADVKSFIEQRFGYSLGKSLSEIQERSLEVARKRAEERRTGIEDAGARSSNAALSCPMAINAFLLGNNFEETIRYAIAMLGDSDTVACMAGYIGAQAFGIPKQLVDETMVYLPLEMVELLNALEPENHFVASRVAPPTLRTWSYDMDIVVFGHGDEQYESGGHEVYPSRINRRPHKGYPIPTIGKSLEEISSGINTFISYAAAHPELRFHVRKVGYDKAGYSVDQIAPLFARAKELKNVLLPQAVVTALGW